ncbi:2OG-Fe dioxygenase family protein [Rhodanobacter sp. 7MK24]|uniref:2OG-Fe dioxygenase family protein n=1 Tax=Rhodanobacter sp. 7MK24 TaxID=2775922 RepID=UPI00177BBC70|nr:2OG-Fe dioxygenase family protein [Rhodanobacter sp. 7MK24]MBD8881336.1 2OG-Fe dioxygenase family protein [Rhodanobacter sp. 7MK24]
MDLPNPSDLHAALQHEGFAFLTADAMHGLLDAATLDDWPAFAASWNTLGDDGYLAARGRLRRRRHAVFTADATTGAIVRQPNQPHYQSLAYNALQGGIERWFEPVEPAIAGSSSLRRILAFCRDNFGALAPDVRTWRIETHQFRIEARADAAGEPTPEGVHRDGVDYVLVLLIDRENIERGTTTIHAPDGRELGQFTLVHAFDAALLDDHRVFHGVTPVVPKDPAQAAHRDVLVVTFKAA